MTQGICLCEGLSYELEGPFAMLAHCHCSMCRKHHGAAFATFAAGPLEGFRWLRGEGAIATYPSSASGTRSFCTTCGSVAPTLAPQLGLAIAPAGNLEGELGIKPSAHLFVGSKAPWYEIADDLPQHEEYPPEFAGATAVPRPRVEPRPGVALGSCLCGEAAFEVADPPLRMMSCHCSRCRRGRSAAHGTNVFYPLAQFRWTRGESRIRDYALPGARFFGTAFCERCGSAMPRVSRERGAVVVPAGSLDTDPGMRPQAHIFVGSKASWFDIAGSVPQFAELPPRA